MVTCRIKAFLIAAILWSSPNTSLSDNHIFIGIIIDDMGYNLEKGDRALTLPGNVTYSILPHARYSRHLAQQAARSGREVMLHMPMENLQESDLGPGGLTSEQSRSEFLETLRSALQNVPNVTGINNHMGSQLTQQAITMGWLMDELYVHNFYFVDSLTTPNSVAHVVAHEKNLLTASRDVFLDNEPSFSAIDESFQKLIRVARAHGSAIAIGHPHRETIDYLQRAIPKLKGQGINLIPASNIAAYQTLNARLMLYAARDEFRASGPVSDIASEGFPDSGSR